ATAAANGSSAATAPASRNWFAFMMSPGIAVLCTLGEANDVPASPGRVCPCGRPHGQEARGAGRKFRFARETFKSCAPRCSPNYRNDPSRCRTRSGKVAVRRQSTCGGVAQLQPPHQHADEEFQYVSAGSGTWVLNGVE